MKKTQEQHLRPFYIHSIRAIARQKSELAIAKALTGRKEEWLGASEERDTPEPGPNWDEIRKELTSSISMQNRDVIRENSLLITSLGLLYLDFADACRTGHSGRIEQCIGCFAVIFQSTKSTRYAREMMHMVSCFKKIWKKEMKEAWLQSCLINISGRPNKFVPDDRFGETIIMLNKENINPSANAKSDEFLRETVSRNVMSLWNGKEALSRATGSTSHGNRHSTVGSFPDICYLVKLLTNESVFHEQLGRGASETELPDLFANGTTSLAKGVLLADYISNSRGNWGTVPSSYHNNNENNAALDRDNSDTVEGRGREMEPNYEGDS